MGLVPAMTAPRSRSPTDADDLVRRFRAVRDATEALAAPLSPEDQQLQSMPACSPTKWHRAHITWFFEEFVLGPHGVAAHDPSYRYLFNSYYDAVGPRHPRPHRGMLSRPSCDAIADYRRAVDDRVCALLRALAPPALDAVAPLVALGLAHEQQHQELLLTDILHAFWQHPLRPVYRGPDGAPAQRPRASAPSTVEGFVQHPGGLVRLGAADDAVHNGHFTFDNEHPRHRVWLEPFALGAGLVTNAALQAFLEADGYRTPSLWLAEGFDFVRAHGLDAPGYTAWEHGALRVFTLDGMVDAQPDAPVAHLSYYEADALARFLGARLPTEAEWEVFARDADATMGNFVDDAWLRPRPSLAPEAGAVAGLFGDVWQWTASAYAPYPGFAPGPGAVGEYNGKFMINQMVLRGGSCLTPRGHVRATYRNFWHPDTRFQMSGLRLARSLGAR